MSRIKQINIAWLDDQIDIFARDNEEFFKSNNCFIKYKAKTAEQLQSFLDKHRGMVDAVIVDFEVDSTNPNAETSTSGFQKIAYIRDKYTPIPFFLCSGFTLQDIEERSTGLGKQEIDYFLKPDENGRRRYCHKSEISKLVEMICSEAESISTPQFKVRQEYDKAFKAVERFGLDAETFVSLLTIDEKTDYLDLREKPVKLRKEIEKLFDKLGEEEVIPSKKLNEVITWFKNASSNPKIESDDMMPKALVSTLDYFAELINNSAHSLYFDEYLKDTRDVYIVKALTIICLDIIKWFNNGYYDLYKDVRPFHFDPFTASIIDKVEREGKQALLVKHEGEEYVLQKNYNAHANIGDKVKVKGRAKDTYYRKDYYVSYDKWERCDTT